MRIKLVVRRPHSSGRLTKLRKLFPSLSVYYPIINTLQLAPDGHTVAKLTARLNYFELARPESDNQS